MKKIICFNCIITVLIAFIVWLLWPMKYTVNIDKAKKDNYIIVESQATTAATWRIIGDENGIYDEPLDATLKGNYPKVSYDVLTGGNKYICYGVFDENVVSLAGYKNAVYNVTDWDIVYPISRGRVLCFMPQKWLCRFDLE